MPQSLTDVNIHFVFSTKHREMRIAPDWSERLYQYIGGILREHKCVLLASGGIPDHVHLLVSLARTISMSECMQVVKSGSSGWVHKEIKGQLSFNWQAGYGGFSVSRSLIPQVKAYIANQAEHHKEMTFQDEFRELLRKHEMEWDERYVWD